MQQRQLTSQMMMTGYTITQSGNYELIETICFMSFKGLEIAARNVTLNMNNYSLCGSIITDAVIKLQNFTNDFKIFKGSVRGGVHGVVLGKSCKNIEVDHLNISEFSFAGFVMKACHHVKISNCTIERALSAPAGSLFGFIGLPLGGFSAASQVLRGRDISAKKSVGGTYLKLVNVNIDNITPIDREKMKLFDEYYSNIDRTKALRTYNQMSPSIVTSEGHIQNSTCPRTIELLNITEDLGRKEAVLGSLYNLLDDTLANPSDFAEIVGAGVHGFSLINWTKVFGLPSQVSTTLPSPLPAKYVISDLISPEWGPRSAVLIRQPPATSSEDPDILEGLSQTPISVTYCMVKQENSVSSPCLLGATGSTVVCIC